MKQAALPILLVLTLCAGCLSKDGQLSLVPQNFFGAPAPTGVASRASLAPAALENAARVDRTGYQLWVANKKYLGFQPIWSTVGVPQLEIFHCNTSHILSTSTSISGISV